jgi:NADH-quinone oxidoreductase subunit A
MIELVTILLIFLAVGAGFLAVNMMVGKFVRPDRPSAEKQTVYECGEPPVGSSWIQFDLRFYVVALLFVIFDVELAFFFPWATVFGNANHLSRSDLSSLQRSEAQNGILPDRPAANDDQVDEQRAAAKSLAWFAFADILFFFGVLVVGFAYLWKRGDLDWVRSTAAQIDLPPSAAET